MPNFLLRNVHINGFRGLTALKIDKFHRINVVGGMNGAGKTRLLETLFLAFDHGNITMTLRPFIWRGLPTNVDANINMLFTNGDKTSIPSLAAMTRLGEMTISAKVEGQPAFTGSIQPPRETQTTSSVEGITVETKMNGIVVSRLHLKSGGADAVDGLVEPGGQPVVLPTCVMLTRRTMDNGADLATKFSLAVERKRKRSAVALAKQLEPRVVDLSLLQHGGQASLFATLDNEDGMMIPVSFLGDGAAALLSIGLSIMQAEGGIVFLDELDAAIHYSRMTQVWGQLIRLAGEYNTQIFAATHSREAIGAVADACKSVGAVNDFLYLRMGQNKDGHTATPYLAKEIEAALAEDWEIR